MKILLLTVLLTSASAVSARDCQSTVLDGNTLTNWRCDRSFEKAAENFTVFEYGPGFMSAQQVEVAKDYILFDGASGVDPWLNIFSMQPVFVEQVEDYMLTDGGYADTNGLYTLISQPPVHVPEINASGATASLTLLLGGLAVILGRRVRADLSV